MHGDGQGGRRQRRSPADTLPEHVHAIGYARNVRYWACWALSDKLRPGGRGSSATLTGTSRRSRHGAGMEQVEDSAAMTRVQ